MVVGANVAAADGCRARWRALSCGMRVGFSSINNPADVAPDVLAA